MFASVAAIASSANISESDRAENSLNFSGHGTILNFPS